MWIINTLFIQICLLVGGGAKQKQIYLKLETFSQVNGDTYYFKCGTGDEYFSVTISNTECNTLHTMGLSVLIQGIFCDTW